MEQELELAADQLQSIAEQVVPKLEGVTNVVEAAKFVPVQYFGKRVENIDEETFIVKKSHVLSIKRYVSAGLALPVNISEVEAFLGYRESGYEALDPASMQRLHKDIHQHAMSWATLERRTKDVGNQLDLFASTFIESGTTIVGFLKGSEAYKNFQGNVDSLSEDEKESLAAIPLGSTDSKRVENLGKALMWARKDIAEFYLDVTSVNGLAIEFSRKISDELLIKVAHKQKIVDEARIDRGEEVDELRQQLKSLDEAIAEKQSEYDSQVGYAFTGLVFGPIGLLVTGGIFGAQAEETRAQKNLLLERKEDLLGKLSKARLSRSLITLATNFTELRALMKDAEQGIKCIEDVLGIVWSSLGVSLEAFEDNATELDLILLVLNLQAIFEPWKTIKGHAKALSAVFNQIVED